MKEVFENIKEKIKNQPIEQFVDTNGNWDLVQTVLDCCCEAVDRVKEEYNNGWIPVSSGRLPEESECVLAFVPNNSTNKIIIAPYHDIYYWKNGTITHWQPLPYQPKGEQ